MQSKLASLACEQSTTLSEAEQQAEGKEAAKQAKKQRKRTKKLQQQQQLQDEAHRQQQEKDEEKRQQEEASRAQHQQQHGKVGGLLGSNRGNQGAQLEQQQQEEQRNESSPELHAFAAKAQAGSSALAGSEQPCLTQLDALTTSLDNATLQQGMSGTLLSGLCQVPNKHMLWILLAVCADVWSVNLAEQV